MDYSQLWGWWNPQAWAPRTLTQPILPGWTFGNVISVTERNSRSPDTEREIVAEHSYGRQLGRVMESVIALVDERPKELPRRPEFDALVQLHREIEDIKLRFAATRLARLEAELDRLKTEAPEDYRRIASKLAGEASG